MSDAETLADLAVRLRMSLSWTQKHWRSISGLPAPFIGAGHNQHPRWRRADLDRYFVAGETAATHPPRAHVPAANAEDPRLSQLLKAAGG